MSTPEDLPTLMRLLVAQLLPDAVEGVVDEALMSLAPEAKGLQRVEQGLSWVGLRVRWVASDGLDVRTLARPDLPLVGVSEDTWWVVDRVWLGRVRARSMLWPGVRWLKEHEIPKAASWARVEPLLPASQWARQGGGMTPTQRLLGLLRSESNDVSVVLVYAVLVGILSLATPLAIQVLINQLAFGVVLQPILFLGLALLVCLTLAGGLRVAKRYIVEIVQRRVFVRAVSDLAARFSRIRIEALDGQYGPELANRFFDVLTVQKATSVMLLDGTTAILQALVGFSLLAVYHPVLLIFDVVALLLVALVLWPLGRGAEKTAIYESKAKYAVAGWLEELARHPLMFKLGGGHLGERRADSLTRKYLQYRSAHYAVFIRQFVGMQVVSVVLSVLLLVSCGWLVLQGSLTLGQLVAAEFIVTSAIAGAMKFTDKLETVYDLLAGIDKLGFLLDLDAERAGGRHRSARAEAAHITLEGVAYVGPTGALPPMNFEVLPGKSLGIYGPAGQGKSTLAELLLGVRRPTAGTVSRDGIPVERLAPEEVYEEALLLRGGAIVQGSLEDNLLMGLEVSADALWAALGEVSLHEAVKGLPDGLDTQLGAAGEPLSESRAVDLQVARALLAKPRLVVVDGLLDGLTPSHRVRLLTALRRKGSTLIVLTEDSALAQLCDRTMALGGAA